MTNQHRTDAAIRLGGGEVSVNQALIDVQIALSRLKYGQIVLTVNGGTVTQIERIERVRILPVPRASQ